MKRIAIYAGSFDPITNGHLDIIRQSLSVADELVVAVGVHPGKEPLFSFDERAKLIKSAAKAVLKSKAKQIRVVSFDNLVVDLARKEKANILVRGLRNSTDFDYEMNMAGMNSQMARQIQTLLLPASPGMGHITGTLVRQIAGMGGDVSPFVPDIVFSALKIKLSSK